MDPSGILALILFVLLFRSAHLGLKYDIEKEKFDRDYKKNHFLRSFAGKLSFILPLTISDSSQKGKIQVLKRSYNTNVYLFWIVFVIIFVISR